MGIQTNEPEITYFTIEDANENELDHIFDYVFSLILEE